MQEVEQQGPGIAESPSASEFAYDALLGQRGTKRARNGESLLRDEPIQAVDTHGIAKGIVASQGPVKLREPDSLVLETERVVEQLSQRKDAGAGSDAVLDDIARELLIIWSRYGKLTKEDVERDGLGPIDDRNVLGKAYYVASLLLQLHHPTASEASQDQDQLQFNQSLRSPRRAQQPPGIHIPKVLFEWLNNYHDPATEIVGEVLQHREGYALARDFWDCVYSCIFRGRFVQVIDLLKGANFAALEDYSDQQLENLSVAVDGVCDLLQQCPAVRDKDWDIKGASWAIFRSEVKKGLNALREFAEGKIPGSDDLGSYRQNAHSDQHRISQASRRAETRVPYEVYEPLQEVHKLLLGSLEDLSKCAFDWVEATIGLAAWWDGNDIHATRNDLSRSQHSANRTQHSRPADVTPSLAYRQRMASLFAQALEDIELKDTFDASDPLQVALASVIQSDVDSVLLIMKGWSITMTSAVAELADAAGWLPDSRPGSHDAMRGLDQSDLMVLSYGDNSVDNRANNKDELLVEYANLLTTKAQISAPELGLSFEGWQLALSVLARLDVVSTVESKANAILEKIPLDSGDRVDALLDLCANLSFTSYGTKIAEVRPSRSPIYRIMLTQSQKYADQLSTSSSHYGSAILYYARAHNAAKVKQTLNALLSLSLIQSLAFPPANALDDRLKSFLASPKQSLQQLASVDTEAARILSCYLSGYATLRDYYSRRDNAHDYSSSASGILQRKRDAAPYLLAAITSAGEAIAGGLFDPNADAVFPVDSLLVLLGEALPFLYQAERVLGDEQLFTLLRVVEDLQTISPKVFGKCEDLYRSALNNASTGDVPSPKALLKRGESSGLSGMTGSSAFSLVGSGMLGSQESGSSGKGSEGSGVLVRGNVRRGWDWRKGVGQSVGGGDVLKVLRVGVARELGRAWGGDEAEE